MESISSWFRSTILTNIEFSFCPRAAAPKLANEATFMNRFSVKWLSHKMNLHEIPQLSLHISFRFEAAKPFLHIPKESNSFLRPHSCTKNFQKLIFLSNLCCKKVVFHEILQLILHIALGSKLTCRLYHAFLRCQIPFCGCMAAQKISSKRIFWQICIVKNDFPWNFTIDFAYLL